MSEVHDPFVPAKFMQPLAKEGNFILLKPVHAGELDYFSPVNPLAKALADFSEKAVFDQRMIVKARELGYMVEVEPTKYEV